MNWKAISFDWNQVRAFLATAEEGSLSAAARVLGSTQPTVGRQVTALEEALGVTLFERVGRSLAITGAGRDLLEHVQAMGDAASRVSMVAAGQSQDVAGTVTLTASDLLAAGYLPGVLAQLHKDAPGIRVEVVASNRVENLTRREADIAIRHVRPDQPDLIAREMVAGRVAFYASAAYVARHGHPKGPADLAGHSFVGPRETDQMLAFLTAQGIDIAPSQFSAASDSAVVMWELMRAGLGIIAGPAGYGARFADVVEVLEDIPEIRFPIWLVTHRELHTSRRIRIVFDALAQAFSRPVIA